MPAFRLASLFTGSRTSEPRPTGYPFTHVRVLHGSAELEEARDQALAFESAAEKAVRERIERYADLGRARVVPISDDGSTASQTPSEREAETPGEDSESRSTQDESNRGYFTPHSGVA